MSANFWAVTSLYMDGFTPRFHSTQILEEGGIADYLTECLVGVGEFPAQEGETSEEAIERVVEETWEFFKATRRTGQVSVYMDGTHYFFQKLELTFKHEQQ
jgi:hypothetical protein